MSPPRMFFTSPPHSRSEFERRNRFNQIAEACERVRREARLGGDRIGAKLAALRALDAARGEQPAQRP